MKLARAIVLAGALCAILLAVFLLRPKSGFRPTSRAVAMKPEAAKPASVDSTLKKVAPVQKPVDVYFLSEAAATGPSAPKSKTMRQPEVNGTRRVIDTQPVTSKADGDFISPHWSPDGLQLLFSKPGYDGLYAKGLNGGPITQITDRPNVGFKAKWGENGQIETRSNTGETQTFNPDGSPVDSVAIETDDSIVGTFTKDDTVFLRQNPGEPARAITAGADRFYGGVISPDGKYVAYNGLATGLYVQPLDGSSPPISLGEGYSPSFLPDSSGIVYNISEDDGHVLTGSDLYLSSLDGKTVSNLTQTPDQVEVNPSVSPDGSHISYEMDGVVYIATLR